MNRPLRALALLVSAAVLAVASGATAARADETVRYRFSDMTVDFGNLHLSVGLAGYELSSPDGGPVSTIMGAFELTDSFMVHAHLIAPMLGFLGAGESPTRAEAGISLHSTSFAVENEAVEVDRSYSGDYVHTKTMTVPVVNRNSFGLDAGVMFRRMGVKLDVDDQKVSMRASHFTAFAGISSINAAGYRLEAQGYGSFANYRWTHGGLDLLFDIAQSYDKDPDDSPSRFGGRLWGETIFGQTIGLSGRLEIGYMPGGEGFYLMASIGGGLNLGL
ncbi:MAG: hypothetical protein KC635_06770 [Myxococcales bacterium]|nr:hypothetical protein [Myxococcales bacterium]MCB9734108.1 hypothetical protein [Deltaproteobacteria bacterium]